MRALLSVTAVSDYAGNIRASEIGPSPLMGHAALSLALALALSLSLSLSLSLYIYIYIYKHKHIISLAAG